MKMQTVELEVFNSINSGTKHIKRNLKIFNN